MLDTHWYAVEDQEHVRRLIDENPWAVLVSSVGGRAVASHYPIMLDADSDELAVFTHVGRPDDELHELGQHEVLLIVQGPQGYVSPSWYQSDDADAPTWNFSVVHCYGVPELLDEQTNFDTLSSLVARFEKRVSEPVLLDRSWALPIAKGTVGVRIPITRFQCKAKMSQDKSAEVQDRILAALRRPGPYHNEPLADDMQRALSETKPRP